MEIHKLKHEKKKLSNDIQQGAWKQINVFFPFSVKYLWCLKLKKYERIRLVCGASMWW